MDVTETDKDPKQQISDYIYCTNEPQRFIEQFAVKIKKIDRLICNINFILICLRLQKRKSHCLREVIKPFSDASYFL